MRTISELRKMDNKGFKNLIKKVMGHKINHIESRCWSGIDCMFEFRHNDYSYSTMKIVETEFGLDFYLKNYETGKFEHIEA